MKLTIDPRIFDAFPGVRVGVVFAHGVDNRGGDRHQLHRDRPEVAAAERVPLPG